MLIEGISEAIAHLNSDEQGIASTGEIEALVASKTHLAFFHSICVPPTDILESQSVGKLNFELGTSACDNAMYISNVNEVPCTSEICNKRISCAGQDWLAGRPGNRPTGASDATRNSEMCLGRYANHAAV